jgi:hypothetical protein
LEDFKNTFLKNAKNMGRDHESYGKMLEYLDEKLKDTDVYKALTSEDLKSVDGYIKTVNKVVHTYRALIEVELGGDPSRGFKNVDEVYEDADKLLKPQSGG